MIKYPESDGHRTGLASMVFKFFDKNSKDINTSMNANTGGGAIKCRIMSNQQFTDALHVLIIKKFKRRTVISFFRDSIWSADLADIQLISKYNKGIRFLLCVIDIYS